MMIKTVKKRLVIFLCFLLILLFFPVKKSIKAIDIEKLKNEKKLFVCTHVESSGPEWALIRDKSLGSELVLLVGNAPDKDLTRMTVQMSETKYLITGDEIGKLSENFWSDTENFKVIWVDKWDVIETVDRSGTILFFLPRDYLTFFDFKH